MAMNTLPSPVRPANPVAPSITSFTMSRPTTEPAANDTSRPWMADPRAAKLLASCAALPPLYADHRARYGNATDRWSAYTGYRIEALEAIRMEIGDRLMSAYFQEGEAAYEPFRQWCEQPNATDAVAAVLVSSTEH